MKFGKNDIKGDLAEFMKIVDTCKKDVFLKSAYGDVYCIKSKLSQYVAIPILVSEHGDELELYCDSKEDEAALLSWLHEHPEHIN